MDSPEQLGSQLLMVSSVSVTVDSCYIALLVNLTVSGLFVRLLKAQCRLTPQFPAAPRGFYC
jgi:hypothetical protein